MQRGLHLQRVGGLLWTPLVCSGTFSMTCLTQPDAWGRWKPDIMVVWWALQRQGEGVCYQQGCISRPYDLGIKMYNLWELGWLKPNGRGKQNVAHKEWHLCRLHWTCNVCCTLWLACSIKFQRLQSEIKWRGTPLVWKNIAKPCCMSFSRSCNLKGH